MTRGHSFMTRRSPRRILGKSAARSGRFSGKTRRKDEGVPCVRRVRSSTIYSEKPLPAAGDFPARQGARTKAYRVHIEYEAAPYIFSEKPLPRSGRFSGKTRRKGEGVPCVRRVRSSTVYSEKPPPAAGDFPARQGARTKAYRVYVESAATQYCRKRCRCGDSLEEGIVVNNSHRPVGILLIDQDRHLFDLAGGDHVDVDMGLIEGFETFGRRRLAFSSIPAPTMETLESAAC